MLFSVAIATWNRAEFLEQTLGSLLSVRVPEGVRFELLVCDNNSTDDTRRVVESFAGRFEGAFGESFVGPVRYLFEQRQGKSFALNRLLFESRGRWVLFTDDDVLVEPGWMEAYVAGMARYPKAGVLGGAMDPWLTVSTGPTQEMLIRDYPAVFAVFPVESDVPIDPESGWAAGANVAMLRAAVPAAGFDTTLGPKAGDPVNGEDVKMVRDILNIGYEGWLLADARVRHYVHPKRLRLRYLWHWQRFIGRAWIGKRGRPTPGRFGVPWWAWKEFVRRAWRVAWRWRPWPDARFHKALVDAAQYWGYLTAR